MERMFFFLFLLCSRLFTLISGREYTKSRTKKIKKKKEHEDLSAHRTKHRRPLWMLLNKRCYSVGRVVNICFIFTFTTSYGIEWKKEKYIKSIINEQQNVSCSKRTGKNRGIDTRNAKKIDMMYRVKNAHEN